MTGNPGKSKEEGCRGKQKNKTLKEGQAVALTLQISAAKRISFEKRRVAMGDDEETQPWNPVWGSASFWAD